MSRVVLWRVKVRLVEVAEFGEGREGFGVRELAGAFAAGELVLQQAVVGFKPLYDAIE